MQTLHSIISLRVSRSGNFYILIGTYSAIQFCVLVFPNPVHICFSIVQIQLEINLLLLSGAEGELSLLKHFRKLLEKMAKWIEYPLLRLG
jgi:hypothetical protein